MEYQTNDPSLRIIRCRECSASLTTHGPTTEDFLHKPYCSENPHPMTMPTNKPSTTLLDDIRADFYALEFRIRKLEEEVELLKTQCARDDDEAE